MGKTPELSLEIGSHSTSRADLGSKRELYAELGVGEYWRYDATGGEFYGEPLVGEILMEGERRRLDMVQEDDARVWSHSGILNRDLWWTEGDLHFWDPAVGRWVLSHEEERDRAEEERTARLTAESRVAELEVDATSFCDVRRCKYSESPCKKIPYFLASQALPFTPLKA